MIQQTIDPVVTRAKGSRQDLLYHKSRLYPRTRQRAKSNCALTAEPSRRLNAHHSPPRARATVEAAEQEHRSYLDGINSERIQHPSQRPVLASSKRKQDGTAVSGLQQPGPNSGCRKNGGRNAYKRPAEHKKAQHALVDRAGKLNIPRSPKHLPSSVQLQRHISTRRIGLSFSCNLCADTPCFGKPRRRGRTGEGRAVGTS